MKYNGVCGIRQHILEISNIANQFNSLKISISKSFLVKFILNSFFSEYDPFKISYNTHKDKWTIHKLIAMCVQEEGRLKQEHLQMVQMVSHNRNQNHKKRGTTKKGKKFENLDNKEKDNSLRCYFCKKKKKKDTWRRTASRERISLKRNVITYPLYVLKPI